MRMRIGGRTAALLVGTLVAFQWSLRAQAPATAKRPLTYDVVDSWRSIAGTRLSHDGRWLAYALTAPGDDGELVVRNLGTNQEFKHPRGTSPSFTADGKFVVFTIVPTKAEDEKVAEQERQSGEAQSATGEEGRGRGRGSQANRTPRSSLGIMTLASGQATTIEKVGSFAIPEESSTWLAYYKGNGGTGGGGGRGGRGAVGGRAGGAGGRQGGAPPAASGEGPQGRGQAASREKRKDPGADLVVRNLTTSEETVIPEVTEYEWDTKGVWLAYATSSTDAAKDGVFARRTTDGTVKTLMTGRGHYKSLTFDETGQQIAFLSDKAEYEKPVSPYRLYLWKTPAGTPSTSSGQAGQSTDTPATELVAGTTPGMPPGMVV